MITTILVGIVSSMVAEVVTALNKKLSGTALKGKAAFLLALLMALIGGIVKVFYIDHTPLPSIYDFASWQAIYPAFAEVWTVAQVYFYFVMKTLGLDVNEGPTPPGNAGGGV